MVWFGLLGYSGNWKIDMERTVFTNVRVVGGINDFDFAYGDKKFAKPVSYKFRSSMMGGLGIGANIAKLDDATLAEYGTYIALYKEIRETVQFGRQYRLRLPRDTSGVSAVEYVSADGAEVLVFAFLRTQKFGNECPLILLQGLDATAMYICAETGARIRGDTLMHIGANLGLHGDLDSKLLRLRKEE